MEMKRLVKSRSVQFHAFSNEFDSVNLRLFPLNARALLSPENSEDVSWRRKGSNDVAW